MHPKVSVITPVYNCERFIDNAIQSVLDQDYNNIEYIIVNDASTDKTRGLIDRYDSRVILWDNYQNSGEQKSVNQGLKLVTGDYFLILNADDMLLPGAIRLLVHYITNLPSSILCVYPDWQVITEDNNVKTNVYCREYDFRYMVKHHTCLPSVGTLFRSETIKLIGYRDCSFQWLGDFDYWLRLGLAGSMAHVPQTLASWRHRTGQASQDKSALRAAEHIRIIKKFYRQCDPVPELLKVQHEAECWSYIVAASVTDKPKESIKYLMTALRLYPHLITSLEFYDTLIQRAKYILRR